MKTKSKYDIYAISKIVCEAAEWRLSPLKLQNILYILQVIYLGHTKKFLIKADFEATEYGPIVRKFFKENSKEHGNSPVDKINVPLFIKAFTFLNKKDINDYDVVRWIIKVVEKLEKRSRAELVAMVHAPGGGWSKKYLRRFKTPPISKKEMLDEYELWKKNKWIINV